jgi:DNA-binding MarR family transcriptional regulator/N-acetylglutamate synthase-like GNAT family acetyltransferase
MDTMKSLGELSMGSRLNRMSDLCMQTIQQAYDRYQIDFDPYLFPAYHSIAKMNSTTNTELRETLHTTQPAVTQTINKLLRKELIEISSDSDDKRKKRISLSEKGTELYDRVQPLWRAMDNAVKKYTRTPANSLLEHIDQFESAVRSGKFLDTIVKNMEDEKEVTISSYNSRFDKVFFDLNIEWLETYFYVEDYDREVLSNPDKYIIVPGGHIFFAVGNDEAIGTVALMKVEEGIYELTKMAVRTDQRGKKIGQQLMQYCIDFAIEHNFKKLILYSNTKLENAIYIYRKYGFIEIEQEPDVPYKRSNIKMELLF